jgi:hypothetical protein
LDVTPLADEALGAILREAQQINGRRATQVLQRVAY